MMTNISKSASLSKQYGENSTVRIIHCVLVTMVKNWGTEDLRRNKSAKLMVTKMQEVWKPIFGNDAVMMRCSKTINHFLIWYIREQDSNKELSVLSRL